MATRTTATRRNSSRSALNSQPIPRWSAQATNKNERAKQERKLSLSDATIAVRWLNGAKDARASASYDRVLCIRRELEESQQTRTKLKKFGPDPDEWDAACRELADQRARIMAGKKSRPVHFPGDQKRETPEGEKLYLELNQQLDNLASSLNKSLSPYIFRPQVVYARLPGSITVLQHRWIGGMVPDDKKRWYHLTIRDSIFSEADAALSLVRLDLTGDLDKIRLCDMCQERWRVAAKSHYRFCGPDCREAYYAKAPGYHARKADTQRKYRKGLKDKAAARVAAFARIVTAF